MENVLRSCVLAIATEAQECKKWRAQRSENGWLSKGAASIAMNMESGAKVT
jgi:hypothetical protein